jgi:hypothetical protein
MAMLNNEMVAKLSMAMWNYQKAMVKHGEVVRF